MNYQWLQVNRMIRYADCEPQNTEYTFDNDQERNIQFIDILPATRYLYLT